MIKINKALRLLVFIFIIININSCYVVDPTLSCSSFKINVRFESITNIDLTGDSVNLPYTKYDKDSIRYIVESIFDTTNILTPDIANIPNININEYSLIYRFDGKTGTYKVIYHLNSIDRDTLVVNINDTEHDKIKIYHNNSYLGILNDQCNAILNIIK